MEDEEGDKEEEDPNLHAFVHIRLLWSSPKVNDCLVTPI